MDTHKSESRISIGSCEKPCRGKWSCVLSHLPMLFVGAALILVIIAGMIFFSRLIDNMKDTRAQVRRYEASRVSVLPDSCGLIEEHCSADSFCKAYEELDRELTSWLSILAFVGALFGLIAPLIGYLLQQHNLKEERKNIKEDLKEKVELYYSNFSKEIKSDIDEKVCDVKRKLAELETHIIRSMEFSLLTEINKVHRGVTSNPVVVANIVIDFDYLLEIVVRWDKNIAIVRAKILEWIDHMDDMWREMKMEQREEVLELLRGKFNPSGEFASRDDFLKILRPDSKEFKWLEKFFAPFARWKFN